MSNTNNTMQTQTSNALHNAIMEAGGKDRPPMLALGIDNDIYSTVDVRPNAMEMWKVIKRLKQFYHPQTYPTHYTQHSTTKSQQAATRNKGKAIANSSPTYEQEPDMVVEDDALSKEKGIDKLMALISLSFKKIYKPTNNNLRTSSNTNRANQDNTPRTNRGTRYDNQRIVNIAGARENVGTQVVHKSEIQCYNCKEYGHVERECHKSKRAKDSAYHKEKMILCKQEEAGIQLSVQEVIPNAADNSKPIFDAEPLQKVQPDDDQYNVFANNRQHLEKLKSVNDTYLDEHGDTKLTNDSLDMSINGQEADQDDDDLAKEHDLFASLIEKLKCEIDDNKNRNKLLESSNKTLVDKLKSEIEEFKNKNKCLESSLKNYKEENTDLA
ncbi:retrovirus-related pol polyprotein from transposon TNT 1-94 [Tanacetum coccineum]